MPNWVQNNLQVIIIIVAMGFSFLSWLSKQLSEQQKKRKAEIDRERRILEELRTGRGEASQTATQSTPQPAPQPTAQESLEAIAARRRAAMGELQRRQQQGGAPAAPPTRSPPMRAPPAGPPAHRRQEMAPGQARQREDRKRAQGRAVEMAQVNAARLETQLAEQQAEADRQQRLRQQEAELVIAAARPARQPARSAVPAMALAFSGGGASLSREELRKMIVLREILDRPVAMRDTAAPF